MAPSAIGAALNNISTPWAVLFAGAIGSLTYDLSTFCTADPPADPNMTAQDWAALLNPFTAVDSVLARSRFRDFLGHYLWDTFCQCDSGFAPAPFPPPTAPTNLPQIDPPQAGPAYPTNDPCNVLTASFHFTGTGTAELYRVAVTDLTYIVGDITASSRDTETIGLPSLYAIARNAAGTALSSCRVSIGTTGTTQRHKEVTVPTGAAYVTVEWGDTAGLSSPIDISATWSLYCGSAGPAGTTGPVPQPCPADPFTQLMLDQILQMVTLIQRQNVPFAYVPGALHTALSGDGSISISGLIGAKITVTNGGYEMGSDAGDPDAIFNVGWVNWGNADGYSERQWIGTTDFLTLPSAAGQYTRLNYSLKPGVVCNVLELVREP